MRTGKREGKSIYGPRPGLEELAKRFARERNGCDIALVRPVLEKVRGGSYFIEALAHPSRDYQENVGWDDTVTPARPIYQYSPGWLVYTLRRDGRIQCSGQVQPERDLIFLGEGETGIDEEVSC